MNILPENISSYGKDLDSLIILITYFSVGWFLVAFSVMMYFVFRYRRKTGQKAAYITGNSFKELKYVLAILVLVVASDFWIDIRTVSVWDRIKIQKPSEGEKIGIQAYQWAWAFKYPGPDGILGTPDDKISYGDMHVPVNKKVIFDLTAKDVLHSFWVKELRLKQDAVPGRTIQGWFEATKTGRYEIMCAEICGLNHTAMKGNLIVDSEEDYKKFIENLYNPPEATQKIDQKDDKKMVFNKEGE